MKFFSSILVFLFLLLNAAWSQVTIQPSETDQGNAGIIYNKEVTFDVAMHTNGFNIGLKWGQLQTYYQTKFFGVSFGELKHIKEFRQQSFESTYLNNFGSSRSFIFGKQNNLFVLRGIYGFKRYFSEKDKRKGLSVGVRYSGGPVLGLLKPYYLDLGYPLDNGTDFTFRSQKYSESNMDVFLDRTRIRGSTGLTKGMGEIRLVPGLHAEGAIHFDWGAFDEFVKALEAGVMVDLFFGNVPIMVEVDNVTNSPLFINLFLNLQLGKRK